MLTSRTCCLVGFDPNEMCQMDAPALDHARTQLMSGKTVINRLEMVIGIISKLLEVAEPIGEVAISESYLTPSSS